MKLLVISHTPHYRQGEQVLGWGPTVRELDYLAARFDELVHLAILHPGAPPESSLPYSAKNLRTVLLPPAGGDRLQEKAGVLKLAPAYLGEIRRQAQTTDVVQVRCPASLSLLALLSLGLQSRPPYRWFKYAGNWRPSAGGEALAYRLQRWLLVKNFARGPVTVNGRWRDQPAHVYSFYNPCLTQIEIEQAQHCAGSKVLGQPLRFLFVGRAESAKGLGQVLHILAVLNQRGIAFHLDVLGGGTEQDDFQAKANALGIGQETSFHGFLPHDELASFYSQAHFILHPSSSEGWPKVLSEAMAYGVVPLASDISSIPQTLAEIGCGVAFPTQATDRYVTEILEYLADPDRWQAESRRGRQARHRFTYEAYGAALDEMFFRSWGMSPLN
jgi:glycosyltransferase involved in cell wall biosynthesis